MIRREYIEGRTDTYDREIAYDHCAYIITKLGCDKLQCIGFTNVPDNILNNAKINQFNGYMYLLYKIKTKIDAKNLCRELMNNFGLLRNNVLMNKFIESTHQKGMGPYYIYILIRKSR